MKAEFMRHPDRPGEILVTCKCGRVTSVTTEAGKLSAAVVTDVEDKLPKGEIPAKGELESFFDELERGAD